MASECVSTQNTQYDKIGTKYNFLHELPAVQPQAPSITAVLGDIKGLRCLGKFLPSQLNVCFFRPSFLLRSSAHMHHVSNIFIESAFESYLTTAS
jgi:hypothetical protein